MTTDSTAMAASLDARILREGYGPGSWHGPDLKAALTGMTAAQVYWRPGSGHNIAEIALHHAYYVHSVRTRLTAEAVEPFPLEGDDWFAIGSERQMGWAELVAIVEREQQRLAALVERIASGEASSPLGADERFDLVLGITCHAVYHAGQIQLLKRLQAG